MKLWLLFSGDHVDGYLDWGLVGVFQTEAAAVGVGVPMLDAEPTKRFRVQRWTLGQVGPDSDEEVH